MSNRRVGLWLIGSYGGVASTATLGLSALSRGLTDSTSLVTALPLFGDLDLDPPSAFVVGGHEIRKGGFRKTVREFQERANVFDRDLTAACAPDLEKWEANVRPGVALNAGPAILRLADWPEAFRADTPRAGVEQMQTDLRAFKEANRLDQVVVVNVTSTEAPFETGDVASRARQNGRGAGMQGFGPAAQRRLRLGDARPRLAVHQLHAVARRLVPGGRGAGPAARGGLRRQGRQDRRDAAQDGAGADVRHAQLAAS